MRHISHKQSKESGGIVLTKRVITSDEFPGTPLSVQKTSRSVSNERSLRNSVDNDCRTELHRESSYGSSSQVSHSRLPDLSFCHCPSVWLKVIQFCLS